MAKKSKPLPKKRQKSPPKKNEGDYDIVEKVVAGQKVKVKIFKYRAPDEDDKRIVESVPTEKVRKRLDYKD